MPSVTRSYRNPNHKMLAVSAQCGIEVTRHELQDTISERDGPLGVFFFPKHANEDKGDTFSEWLIPDQEPDDPESVAVLQSAAQAMADPDDPLTGSESFEDLQELLQDELWPCWVGTEDGGQRRQYGVLEQRCVLEPLLQISWNRLGPTFQQLPNTARWTIQGVVGVCPVDPPMLMAVLCDDNAIHLLLPTSAKCSGALTMPDPYQARDQAAGHDLEDAHGGVYPYCGDVWFEDCCEGGAYVIGLDDKVLIFYVDNPGDMVYGRWQCTRSHWEAMWLEAFGSTSVAVDS